MLRTALVLMSGLFVASLLSLSAFADANGEHPAFLHALTDLRAARWHLNHRGGSDKLKKADAEAVKQIDECINDIKKASIDDGKNLDDHPAEDAGADKVGPDHRARQLLEQAKKDIEEKESNPKVKELRKRSVKHLEEAMKHIDKAIQIGK